MAAATAVLLAFTLLAPQQAPDLQVQARTASGAAAPEFAAAVSRALVVTGATVVMGARASELCASCVLLEVIEEGPGRYRIEARQSRHWAAATLEVSAETPLFERARAVAVQARLLIDWSPQVAEPVQEPPPAEAPARREPSLPPPRVEAPRAPQSRASVPPSNRAPEAASVSTTPEILVETFRPQPAAPKQAPPTPPGPAAPVEVASSPEPILEKPAPIAPIVVPPPPLPLPPSATEQAGAAPSADPGGLSSTLVAEAGKSSPLWPWIPTVTGAGAGIAAGACAIASRSRYDALVNKVVGPEKAAEYREEGKRLQTASFVLTGVAVVAVAAGVVGFSLGPASASEPLSVTAASLAGGGGVVGVSGSLP